MIDGDYSDGGYSSERASDARDAANQARSAARSAAQDVNHLYLVVQALWEILKEQHGYTDRELALRVQEIDLRDGNLDGGRRRGPAKECPACGRKIQGNHQKCLYCGEVILRDPFER
jgi:hypothetical protein